MKMRLALVAAMGLAGVLLLSGCGPTYVAKFDAGKSMQKKMEFQTAIQMYQEYIAENPKSPLVPYAMLYTAECYRDLADKEAAMAAYKKVADQFPGTEVAQQAEIAMRDIKDKVLVPVAQPKPKPEPKPEPKKESKKAPAEETKKDAAK